MRHRAHFDCRLVFAAGDTARDWSDHVALAQSLLGDDPTAVIDALAAAARDGASPADLLVGGFPVRMLVWRCRNAPP